MATPTKTLVGFDKEEFDSLLPEEKVTIKLILIEAKERLSENNPFPRTCITITDPLWKSDPDIVMAYRYLLRQKPTKTRNRKFFEHKHYTGEVKHWWGNHREGQPRGLLKEKRRYMQHIIDKL